MPDVKLTEAYIKNLDSAVEFADKKSNEIYYNDTEQRGLTLILNRGGRKAYFFRFNGKKQQIKKSIADVKRISLAAAREKVRFWNNELLAGRNPFLQARFEQEKTFSAVYNTWLKWSQDHQQDPKSYYMRSGMKACRGVLTYFDNIPLDQVNNKTVEDYRADRAEDNNASINRYIVELKFMMRWALEHNIIKEHHANEIKKFPETSSVKKTHHFTPEERKKLLETVEEVSKKNYWGRSMAYILPLTQLLLATGMRPGSALGLVWDDVDLLNGEIKLRAANIKTRKDARIYISPQMIETLRNWKEQTTGLPQDHIFPGDGTALKSVKKQYKRLFEKAGLDSKYSAYSLRHDCASELLAAGANLTDVQMALVHTDPRTTMKYAHPSAERMKQVAALLDNKETK